VRYNPSGGHAYLVGWLLHRVSDEELQKVREGLEHTIETYDDHYAKDALRIVEVELQERHAKGARAQPDLDTDLHGPQELETGDYA
jgi:hypothetical protein